MCNTSYTQANKPAAFAMCQTESQGIGGTGGESFWHFKLLTTHNSITQTHFRDKKTKLVATVAFADALVSEKVIEMVSHPNKNSSKQTLHDNLREWECY